VRDYTASMVTYNLTIDSLHTYYVEAGSTPVLVHNSSCTSIALGKQTVGSNDLALDEFGMETGGQTYKEWSGKGSWYNQLKGFLSDGTTQIHVNLDGINDPAAYARSGANVNPAVDDVGMTRWEMYQLSTNSGAWDRVTWYRGGSVVSNPFGG
jgi:hypothetical protein